MTLSVADQGARPNAGPIGQDACDSWLQTLIQVQQSVRKLDSCSVMPAAFHPNTWMYIQEAL